MSRRLLVSAAVVGIAAGALALPSSAAPPKPITKSYTVNLLPFPNQTWSSGCFEKSPIPSDHEEPFSAPAAGVLKVVITDFEGDFDGGILDGKGKYLAPSDNASQPTTIGTGAKETITYKVKKPQDLVIRVCNFSATPQATVTYTFTFNK